MGESVLTVRPQSCFLCGTQVATVPLNLPTLGIPGLAVQKSGCLEEVGGPRPQHGWRDRGNHLLWGAGRTPDTHLERGEGQVQLAFYWHQEDGLPF